jgi:uncharacterized protein (DUF433 family)
VIELTRRRQKLVSSIYKGKDPRDIGTYTFAQASRYIDVPVATIRSWFLGGNYKTQAGLRCFEPVLLLPEAEYQQLSFTNLVEIHVLRSIRNLHRVTLEKVRQAVSCMTTKFDEEHPLARIDLHTDGLDLFVRILEDTINVSDGQQTLLLRGSLETHLRRIERDETKLAKCLYPFTRTSDGANSDAPKSIVIDPRISFGKPVIAGTGIPTAVLAGRYKAGDSIEVLAEDYQCEPAKIQEAVRCELSIAA